MNFVHRIVAYASESVLSMRPIWRSHMHNKNYNNFDLNRRIELRFIMRSPTPKDIKRLKNVVGHLIQENLKLNLTQ